MNEELNPLTPWLKWELTEGLRLGDIEFDDNCELDIYTPAGLHFNIFVDCGDFDYFDFLVLPNGDRLEFGHPLLRELENQWDAEQNTLFREALRA